MAKKRRWLGSEEETAAAEQAPEDMQPYYEELGLKRLEELHSGSPGDIVLKAVEWAERHGVTPEKAEAMLQSRGFSQERVRQLQEAADKAAEDEEQPEE